MYDELRKADDNAKDWFAGLKSSTIVQWAPSATTMVSAQSQADVLKDGQLHV